MQTEAAKGKRLFIASYRC